MHPAIRCNNDNIAVAIAKTTERATKVEEPPADEFCCCVDGRRGLASDCWGHNWVLSLGRMTMRHEIASVMVTRERKGLVLRTYSLDMLHEASSDEYHDDEKSLQMQLHDRCVAIRRAARSLTSGDDATNNGGRETNHTWRIQSLQGTETRPVAPAAFIVRARLWELS